MILVTLTILSIWYCSLNKLRSACTLSGLVASTTMSLAMSESVIRALKDALRAQQQLLQKLYNELDVEREASATAASEALSMILRLQGEKAAVKMEANQYKRLAEEKMCLAEEALGNFEDLIYQKEMEIASLEYQVQAYRYKLLSLDCNDIGVWGSKFPENLLQRNENLDGDMGAQSNLRRNSMPPIPLKFSYQKKGTVEKEGSASPEENRSYELSNQSSDMEKKLENSAFGDIISYWEQISKLDEIVREIADCKGVKSANLRCGSGSSSLASQVSSGLLLDPARGAIATKSGQIKNPEKLMENEATATPCFSGVHDVFEVPKTHENDHSCGGQIEQQRKLTLEGNEMLGKPDSVLQDAVKSYAIDETGWVKKLLPSTHHESSLCRPSNGVAVDCLLALAHPGIGVAESHSKFEQLNRAEITEFDRHAARQETTIRGEEELELLKEIQGQLNSIVSEIRSLRTKQPSPSYELPLLSVTEAMLQFWL